MYLEKRTYVKNWDYMSPEERHSVSVLKGGRQTAIRPERVSYIVEEVCYWRKANQIHRWFVENVQEGVDDCGSYCVPLEKLAALRDLCTTVLKASKLVKGKISNGEQWERGAWQPISVDGEYIEDPTSAQLLLPTQQGFFFGHTDYDQYYLDDVRYTEHAFTALLNEPNTGSLYYSSSW